MATQRGSRELAEFVKFTTLGAAVFGRITRQDENGNGRFVTLSPAGFRSSSGAAFARYGEVAVGLSTDLASKVEQGDTGKLMLFVFVGTKPTKRDPMKLFNVWEISGDDAKALLDGKPMPAEWSAPPQAAVSGDDEQDDLPF